MLSDSAWRPQGCEMLRRDWLLVAVLSICVAAAIGAAFYMLAGGTAPMIAAVVAVMALCMATVLLMALAMRQINEMQFSKRNIARELIDLAHGGTESKRQIDRLMMQNAELRADAARNNDAVAAGFAELKNSYSGLAGALQGLVANGREAPVMMPVMAAPQPVLAAPQHLPIASPFGEQLLVSLEPIVDLHTGSTAHYRIHLGMVGADGVELGTDMLLHHADRSGVRAQLDIFMGREAALLLRRLRRRDVDLNLFMPIGAETLGSPQALQQLMADRVVAADVAAGLAFEIPHASLAGLTEQALEGLAHLARQGAVLSLANVSLAGLDLNAMNTLNVRFVGLDVAAIDPAHGPTSAMVGFAQAARASKIQMIVSGVANPRVVASLPQITRLAAGPCFALPRRVKREMADAAFNGFTAAA